MANAITLIVEKEGKRETFRFKTSQGSLRHAERKIRRYLREKWRLVDCSGSDPAMVQRIKDLIAQGAK
jgi:hypothetical protein